MWFSVNTKIITFWVNLNIFWEKTTELQNYYSIKETKKLEKVLEIVKNWISNEDKELIIERFEDYWTDDYFFENSDYPEDISFEEYLSIFRKILEIVCDDEIRINDIIDKFKETFTIINEYTYKK